MQKHSKTSPYHERGRNPPSRQDQISRPSFRLSFKIRSTHILIIPNCKSRNYILKILSHKKWKPNYKTLGNIYKTLIGSIIDYSFILADTISDHEMARLQVIQNNAVRTIFKLPYDTPSNVLREYEA